MDLSTAFPPPLSTAAGCTSPATTTGSSGYPSASSSRHTTPSFRQGTTGFVGLPDLNSNPDCSTDPNSSIMGWLVPYSNWLAAYYNRCGIRSEFPALAGGSSWAEGRNWTNPSATGRLYPLRFHPCFGLAAQSMIQPFHFDSHSWGASNTYLQAEPDLLCGSEPPLPPPWTVFVC